MKDLPMRVAIIDPRSGYKAYMNYIVKFTHVDKEPFGDRWNKNKILMGHIEANGMPVQSMFKDEFWGVLL